MAERNRISPTKPAARARCGSKFVADLWHLANGRFVQRAARAL
jgi:hypothetical protein